MEKLEIEVLSKASNSAVVQLPWRAFPGVVVQGDSLKSLHDDLEELRQELVSSGAASQTIESLRDIESRIGEYLQAYEAAVTAKGGKLPYKR